MTQQQGIVKGMPFRKLAERFSIDLLQGLEVSQSFRQATLDLRPH
jgi:hypothetical protein